MAWDWEKSLSDVTESIADVFKAKYSMEYAKEAQPLVQETVSKIIIPLIIVVGVFAVILVKKW